MTFVSRQQVRFAHVDAAGIVFYPRYFEMLNEAVEDYFARELGVGFAEMHFKRRLGVPTVKLECEFVAPSRLGDILDFIVDVERVGRSSVELVTTIRSGDDIRFRVHAVLVCMDLDSGRSQTWPEDMRPQDASTIAA